MERGERKVGAIWNHEVVGGFVSAPAHVDVLLTVHEYKNGSFDILSIDAFEEFSKSLGAGESVG